MFLKYFYDLRLEKHVITTLMIVYKYQHPTMLKVRDFTGWPSINFKHAHWIIAKFELTTSTRRVSSLGLFVEVGFKLVHLLVSE